MRMSEASLGLLVLLLAAPATAQQLSNLPDLNTATQTTASSSSAAASTSSAAATSTSASVASTSSNPATTSAPASTRSATTTFSLGSLPTIAGAGIPTMIVPYTAGAPFMQESSLPEGTIFIAVGAVLAFLGVCVLLWRGMVAWSINRSVKQAALASVSSRPEKASTNWGRSAGGYNPARGSMYKTLGSSMSMEALTAAGKPVKSHFKDHESGRNSPPANLFFSPTAQARSDAPRPLSDVHANRNSAYLPAGYYASPSSQAAGGQRTTTVGGSLAPYARNSSVPDFTPPSSPGLPPTRVNQAHHNNPARDSLRAPSRDGLGARNSYHQGLSASNLNSAPGNDGLAGSRAPSAYLEDLFENHTAMASRDRL